MTEINGVEMKLIGYQRGNRSTNKNVEYYQLNDGSIYVFQDGDYNNPILWNEPIEDADIIHTGYRGLVDSGFNKVFGYFIIHFYVFI